MALIGNYSVLNKTPGRWLGGSSAAHASGVGAAQTGQRANWNRNGQRNFAYMDGETAAQKLIGFPTGGYADVAWMYPMTAGALSSHRLADGTTPLAALTLASGRNLAGQADGAATAAATLQLVVSMLGTSAGAALAEGNIRAALLLAGLASGSASGAATLGALAWATGTAAGSATATLVRYATGRLAGSITPFTDLSPENLAAAVMAAAQAEPIHADIRRVNGYAVNGDGQAGTEWGPA